MDMAEGGHNTKNAEIDVSEQYRLSGPQTRNSGIQDKPKFPEYQTIEMRMRTFKSWKNEWYSVAVLLSEAGQLQIGRQKQRQRIESSKALDETHGTVGESTPEGRARADVTVGVERNNQERIVSVAAQACLEHDCSELKVQGAISDYKEKNDGEPSASDLYKIICNKRGEFGNQERATLTEQISEGNIMTDKGEKQKSEIAQDGNQANEDEQTDQSHSHNNDPGVELVIIDPDAVDVDFNHSRIAKIENLEQLRNCETLCLRQNLITKIEGLSTLTGLTDLDLYDNQITVIENLDQLVNLGVLDLSFNRISKIENLQGQTLVRKLFLTNNKITVIENIDHMTCLDMLELGANRIRKIENITTLTNLTSIFLGRNKITKLEGLDSLVNLTTLSMQGNRITKIEGLDKLVNLDGLYLSENGIEAIEGLENNTKLTTLDLASNKISKIENIAHLTELEEFWFNSNRVESWKEIEALIPLKKLETVYLEHNPIYLDPNNPDSRHPEPNYRRKIKLTIPWIKQIDATLAQS